MSKNVLRITKHYKELNQVKLYICGTYDKMGHKEGKIRFCVLLLISRKNL